MDPQESIFLALVAERLNQLGLRGAHNEHDHDDAPIDTLTDALERMSEVALHWDTFSRKMAQLHTRARRNHFKRTRRGLLKRLGAEFRDFEYLLASAEAVNVALGQAFSKWLNAISEEERTTPLLALPNSVGGLPLKGLLLISMHGRLITYASEIELLLRHGFTDGAASRMRTLYEAATKVMLISLDQSPSKATLAERFSASVIFEVERIDGFLDQDGQDLKDAAIAAWGDRFFKSEHNWAAPAVQSASSNVTFRDIENAVGMDALRRHYLRGNAAVHSGPLGAVQSTSTGSGRYFAGTRPTVDAYSTSVIAHTVIHMLSLATLVAASTLCWQFEEWDDAFAMSEFYVVAERLRVTLAATAKRHDPDREVDAES